MRKDRHECGGSRINSSLHREDATNGPRDSVYCLESNVPLVTMTDTVRKPEKIII